MEVYIFTGLFGAMIIAGALMGFRGKSKRTRITGISLGVVGIVMETWFLIGVAFY